MASYYVDKYKTGFWPGPGSSELADLTNEDNLSCLFSSCDSTETKKVLDVSANSVALLRLLLATVSRLVTYDRLPHEVLPQHIHVNDIGYYEGSSHRYSELGLDACMSLGNIKAKYGFVKKTEITGVDAYIIDSTVDPSSVDILIDRLGALWYAVAHEGEVEHLLHMYASILTPGGSLLIDNYPDRQNKENHLPPHSTGSNIVFAKSKSLLSKRSLFDFYKNFGLRAEEFPYQSGEPYARFLRLRRM